MHARIMSVNSSKSLTAIQFIVSDTNSFEYISGNSAIKQNKIEVKELNNSGNVNMLSVINRSNEFVFFSDGDILVGAKQNRTLNTSLLLAPETKETIPVSCVEQGRWAYKSNSFAASEYDVPIEIRRKKSSHVHFSLLNDNGYFADQGQIWNDIHFYSRLNNASSSTSDLYEMKMKSYSQYQEELNTIPVSPESSGICFFVNDRLLSVEVFNRSSIYFEYFPKRLHSAFEFGMRVKPKNVPEVEIVEKFQDFMDSIDNANAKIFPAVSSGTEKRFKTANIEGFQLLYNNLLIHMILFNSAKTNRDEIFIW